MLGYRVLSGEEMGKKPEVDSVSARPAGSLSSDATGASPVERQDIGHALGTRRAAATVLSPCLHGDRTRKDFPTTPAFRSPG